MAKVWVVKVHTGEDGVMYVADEQAHFFSPRLDESYTFTDGEEAEAMAEEVNDSAMTPLYAEAIEVDEADTVFEGYELDDVDYEPPYLSE